MKTVEQKLSDAETNRLMEEYEDFQDMEERAARRGDLKLARQYQATLRQLEEKLFPWMTEGLTRA